jgi:hypothetical protein
VTVFDSASAEFFAAPPEFAAEVSELSDAAAPKFAPETLVSEFAAVLQTLFKESGSVRRFPAPAPKINV